MSIITIDDSLVDFREKPQASCTEELEIAIFADEYDVKLEYRHVFCRIAVDNRGTA